MQTKNTKKRVLLTGGHARSTAYAVFQELKIRHADWELFWIGPKNVIEGENVGSYDSEVFPKLGVHYYSTITGRFQRKFTKWTIPSILKMPIGFVQTFFYVLSIRPNVTLSFGGFTAFPVVIASWVLNKPVVLHEQTSAVGRANLHSAFFAKKIALARSDSREFFPKTKCVVTGNPVSKEILNIGLKKYIRKVPNIFITGGASGSQTINNMVDKVLDKLLASYSVSHQVGKLQFSYFKKKRANLSAKYRRRYQVYSVIPSWDWYKFMDMADIVVSRAGANITSELMIAKRPALLIPLPLSFMEEQKKNAVYAQNFGVAKIIEQENLSPDLFLRKLKDMQNNWDKIVNSISAKKSPDTLASKRVVDIIESFIKP